MITLTIETSTVGDNIALVPDSAIIVEPSIVVFPNLTLDGESTIVLDPIENSIDTSPIAVSGGDMERRRPKPPRPKPGPIQDPLFGDELDNVLVGTDLDDYIFGLDGDDTLIGGVGRDVLTGGAGSDLLVGGADADGFVLDDRDAMDIISDFATDDSDLIYVDAEAFQVGTDEYHRFELNTEEGVLLLDGNAIASFGAGSSFSEDEPAIETIIEIFNPADFA